MPDDTIAFAGCILDRLSRFFVRSWRKECERMQPWRRSFQAHPTKPELIVLAALVLANGFLNDASHDIPWWAIHVADDEVGSKEIDATVNCILKDIDYGLFSIKADEVEATRKDMYGDTERGRKTSRQVSLNTKGSGAAVVNKGLYTPERTPSQ